MGHRGLIGSSVCFSLWINAVILFCFSKKILPDAIHLLIGITKSGKIHLSKIHHTNQPGWITPSYSIVMSCYVTGGSRSFAILSRSKNIGQQIDGN
ncbi:Uncharacterised protein [Escherichia coli]|nr:Uncharacterised protein [Escherichia coli]VVY77421.1 Uncharacterised protein [Escherichia coli]VWN06139.1 Uncharacterised protein [Escherichia coli]